MKIKSLKLKNFRNIEEIEFNPFEGVNVIYGENAQGKTNLIEAVWLFTGAKSFRGAKDAELKKFGCENAVIEAVFENEGIEQDAKIIIENRRKAFLNGKPLSSAAALAGNFQAIIFSPVDLSLVREGPKERRRFLDIAIGQIYPKYINCLKAYTRAVTQRNLILKEANKTGQINNSILSAFEAEICDNGKKIIEYRLKYIEKITPFLSEIYSGLTGKRENLSLKYINSLGDKDFSAFLVESRKIDMQSGITSAGPHRDDIEFFINNISARNYGSQGQMRSVALCLKLAQAQVIKEITGEYPIALLDDVMSELDPKRQEYILNHIKGWQVLITACEPDIINRLESGKCVKIEKGKVSD